MPLGPSYVEFPPSPPLAPYVACYWALTGCTPNPVLSRVLPDGCVDLVVVIGDPVRVTGARDPGPAVRLVGAMRRAMLIELAGHVAVIGVRFRPAGAAPFVTAPLDEITDGVAPPDDLWRGRQIGIDLGELAEATARDGPAAAVRRLEAALLRQLSATPRPDPLVVAGAATILAAGGQVAIGPLTAALEVTPRRLERAFARTIGLSPKSFCRVARFQRTLALARRRPDLGWASVAVAGGFADQAHLTREFTALAGLPPGSYLEEQARVANVQDVGRGAR
jgi:AraC-like DNA-binding protein